MFAFQEYLKKYWIDLSPLSKTLIIGSGIYFGITSLMAWSVGSIINNSLYCRPKLPHRKEWNGNTYAIVTGANRGIGFEIAKDLMLSGCNVIIACRNEKKANKAINTLRDIGNKYGKNNGKLLFVKLDLASKQSVDAFLETFFSLNIECNVLIHNAAINAISDSDIDANNSFGADTMNLMWQINYLSPFYLTLSLLDHIVEISKKYKYGRIVNVNSFAHCDGTAADIEYFMDASYVNAKVHTNGVGLYASTKLAAIMFISKLHEYIGDNYENTVNYLCVSCVHPGFVNTDFLWTDWKIKFFYVQWYLFALLSAKQGAIQVLHAVHCDMDNEKYLVNGGYHTNGLYLELSEKTKGLINKYKHQLWNKSISIWPVK